MAGAIRTFSFDGYRLLMENGDVWTICAHDITELSFWFRGQPVVATALEAPEVGHLLRNLKTGGQTYAMAARPMDHQPTL